MTLNIHADRWIFNHFQPQRICTCLTEGLWTVISKRFVLRTDTASYQPVITKSYLCHPGGRDGRACQDGEKDRGGKKREKCQTVWPFLGNPTSQSVGEINLHSSFWVICLHSDFLCWIPTVTQIFKTHFYQALQCSSTVYVAAKDNPRSRGQGGVSM